MVKQLLKTGSLLLILAQFSGCSSVTSVVVEHQFPEVRTFPRTVKASVIFDAEFSSYLAKPNKKTEIAIGRAQTQLLSQAFRGLFSEVEFVGSRAEVASDTQLLITPRVREVQMTTPSDNYLNVYEVWIKYSLDIETEEGVAIENWFMPAYGKTPDSFMLSKEDAIQDAAIVALRDAGAKLILDFYRIPSINDWFQRQQPVVEAAP